MTKKNLPIILEEWTEVAKLQQHYVCRADGGTINVLVQGDKYLLQCRICINSPGFIKSSSYDHQQSDRMLDAREMMRNYPEIFPREKKSAEQSIEELYGGRKDDKPE